MPPPLQEQLKIPVAAEVLKATDHLLNPPPSFAGLTHPTQTLFPVFAFHVVDSTVRPLQTTINILVPDDKVGPGTFYINWPQLQLIRSLKLEPCSLGSVNVITAELQGVPAGPVSYSLVLFVLLFYRFLWNEKKKKTAHLDICTTCLLIVQ